MPPGYLQARSPTQMKVGTPVFRLVRTIPGFHVCRRGTLSVQFKRQVTRSRRASQRKFMFPCLGRQTVSPGLEGSILTLPKGRKLWMFTVYRLLDDSCFTLYAARISDSVSGLNTSGHSATSRADWTTMDFKIPGIKYFSDKLSSAWLFGTDLSMLHSANYRQQRRPYSLSR